MTKSRFAAVCLVLLTAAAPSPDAGASVPAPQSGAEIAFAGGRLAVATSGIDLFLSGKPVWTQPRPCRVQVYGADGRIVWAFAAYSDVALRGKSLVATGSVTTPAGSEIRFEDVWSPSGPGAILKRSVEVGKAGAGDRGFLSAFELETTGPSSFGDFEPFMPGVLYGDDAHLSPSGIGGRANFDAGVRDVFVREDRIPAPLIALRGRDGAALSVIHADPRGDTNVADSEVPSPALVDGVFKFGSLGYRESSGRVSAGMWYPGAEGAVSYFGRDAGWTRRYHPVRPGMRQEYSLEIGLARDADLPATARRSWRRAFGLLDPKVVLLRDVDEVKATVMAHVSGRTRTFPNGAAGMPFLAHAHTGEIPTDPRVYGPNLEDPNVFGLGFCAANETVGYWLLRLGRAEKNDLFVKQGLAIFDHWSGRTKADPVSPTYYFWNDDRFGACYRYPPRTGPKAVSIREICEGHYGCLKAWEAEKAQGIDHPGWLAWCRSFGDWLLARQLPSGAYPRWFGVADGKVLDPSTTSSYAVVPFLSVLARATGDGSYLKAAARAAEFMWNDHHRKGVFVGGAIDKPNLIDKEAAAISLEGYLALYGETKDKRWLEAAKMAGEAAATYMYIWDVPMPADADPAKLNWKPGATTVGVQLVATGSSGVDQWLSWNVDEFAQLYDLTGDPLYLAVTRILFHNTKAMLALPGRVFDLVGPGWQQEAWTLSAPDKGRLGGARLETGWVAICHVAGIMKLKLRNPELYKKVAGGRP